MQNELLNRAEVCRFFGGTRPINASTLYRGIRKLGRYPKPVKVGPGSSRWLRSECETCPSNPSRAEGVMTIIKSIDDQWPVTSHTTTTIHPLAATLPMIERRLSNELNCRHRNQRHARTDQVISRNDTRREKTVHAAAKK